MSDETKHAHYFKDVRHLNQIDVYRVLDLFEVKDPCIQHAVKKLLCAGNRGAKDFEKDLHESIDSLRRCLEMRAENSATMGTKVPTFFSGDPLNTIVIGERVIARPFSGGNVFGFVDEKWVVCAVTATYPTAFSAIPAGVLQVRRFELNDFGKTWKWSHDANA